jgi:hypothetical protein
MLHSFLAGTGELGDPDLLSSLRIGTPLALQRGRAAARLGGRSRIEVRTQEGRALGYLPPEDDQLLAGLLEAGASCMVRVRGLVPAFQRSRVQLEIEILPASADPA